MKRNVILIWLILIATSMVACSVAPSVKPHYSGKAQKDSLPVTVGYSSKQIKRLILSEFDKWEGTPHKMGGNSKRGIDCSGFVHMMYRKVFNINVPRSTELFQSAGKSIRKQDLLPGDIVVFRPHSYPRHVGIYVGDNRFIHASTSKGVMMSTMDNPYWKKHYKMSRRLILPGS